MLLDLFLTSFTVAFALSTLEVIDKHHVVYGIGRVLVSVVVAALSLVALGVPGGVLATIVAVPATTYCGAALHTACEYMVTRMAVIDTRRRLPRL